MSSSICNLKTRKDHFNYDNTVFINEKNKTESIKKKQEEEDLRMLFLIYLGHGEGGDGMGCIVKIK